MLRTLCLFALLATQIAAGEEWRFGDGVDLTPRGHLWSEVSVLRRPVPIAPHRTDPVRARLERELLGVRVRVERVPRSDLFEQAQSLADLRDGRRWDPVVDRYGFWDAATMECGLPGLTKPAATDRVATMFCTVYYTPLEEGFTAERGFDVTPETRPGLGGRKYAHDFLRAVIVEGFGRLEKPVGGKKYIKYDGRWGYATRILGNRNNTLVDRKSAAVYRRNPWMTKNAKLIVIDPEIFASLGSMEWQVADTGGGLQRWQMDLYWGEDLPLGPGLDRFRPASCPFAIKFWLPVVVSKP